MNSIKNAIVTVTLLVVGYGSYIVLKEPVPAQFAQLPQSMGQPGSVAHELTVPTIDVPTLNVQVGIEEDTINIETPEIVIDDSPRFNTGASLPNARLDRAATPSGQPSQFNLPNVSQTLDSAKTAVNQQIEKTKTLAKEKLEQLKSDLPPLPNLLDSAGTTDLPELTTKIKEELAEATPEEFKLDEVANAVQSKFEKLKADVVEPLKASIEPPVAALVEPKSSNNIPPPFATKRHNPFANTVAPNRNDPMPQLPSVRNWDEYEGPQISPEDLAKSNFEVPKQETAEPKSRPQAELSRLTTTEQTSEALPQTSRFEASRFEASPFEVPVATAQSAMNAARNIAPQDVAPLNHAPQPVAARESTAQNFSVQPPTSQISPTKIAPNYETTTAVTQFPSTAPAGEVVNQHVKSTLTPVKIEGPVSSAATKVGDNAVFERVWSEVQTLLREKKYTKALRTLTPWNAESNLNEEQNARCIQLLDQLAGTLIYSRKSYLDSPYVVQAGETLDEIAAKYAVPQALLAKINGIAAPYALSTGEELKVVKGPFRATVSLSRNELTLFAGPHYAGRFPVKIGRDLPPESAFYEIGEKSPGRTYFDRKLGREIIRDEANNRYGKYWMGLRGEHITTGHSVGIHSRPSVPISDEVGSISLDPLDAEDVFSILTVGSRIEVRP